MKILTLILSLALLISCGKKEKYNSQSSQKVEGITSDTLNNKITFYKVNGKGILLGDNIKLLDDNFKEIKDISYLNRQFVGVSEVSDKYYKSNPIDDYCQEFKYVKIKSHGLEGYVDGRKVYEPIKSFQNKFIKIDNNEISLITTNNFAVGVSDDDGLTGCTINTPAIFSDKTAKYEGLLIVIKNKNYESNYPYFELKDDDGASDEIQSIEKRNDKYLLKIQRTYQEGRANILVAIYKDEGGTFVAEILENERTEE